MNGYELNYARVYNLPKSIGDKEDVREHAEDLWMDDNGLHSDACGSCVELRESGYVAVVWKEG